MNAFNDWDTPIAVRVRCERAALAIHKQFSTSPSGTQKSENFAKT